MATVIDRTITETQALGLHEVAPPTPVLEGTRADRWRAALSRGISGRWALAVALSWLVVPVCWMLEPAPADPNAVPAWAAVVGSVWQLAVLAALIGLWQRRRLGIALSFLALTVLLADSVACPLSGHHTFGAWWVAEIALVLGAFGLSARALRRT